MIDCFFICKTVLLHTFVFIAFAHPQDQEDYSLTEDDQLHMQIFYKRVCISIHVPNYLPREHF